MALVPTLDKPSQQARARASLFEQIEYYDERFLSKGVYVLAIQIAENVRINVGALGCTDFVKGLYAYVGSAQNGLEKRIERHFRKSKRKFWHIDYLLDSDHVKILEVFHKEGEKIEECKLAKNVCKISFHINGFGSSDCKCASHLFKLKSHKTLKKLMHETGMQSGGSIEQEAREF